MSNDNHRMRIIKNHVTIPSKWVGKTLRMILMTAVMLSLFTSAAILTVQNSGSNNIAFAKKATSDGSSGGSTSSITTDTKTTKPKVETATPKVNKDTKTNGNGNTPPNGASNGALLPGHIPLTRGQPDKLPCPKGERFDKVAGCINAGPIDLPVVCQLNHLDCSTGNVNNPHGCVRSQTNSTASVHCPNHKPTTPTPSIPHQHHFSKDYMKRYNLGWSDSCSDDMAMTHYKATLPHSTAYKNGYFDARHSDGPCP
jgi:hypothetical protein